MDRGPAPRNIRLDLSDKDARLLRHRITREQKLMRIIAQKARRKLTDDERNDIRRYRRMVNQLTAQIGDDYEQ